MDLDDWVMSKWVLSDADWGNKLNLRRYSQVTDYIGDTHTKSVKGAPTFLT